MFRGQLIISSQQVPFCLENYSYYKRKEEAPDTIQVAIFALKKFTSIF